MVKAAPAPAFVVTETDLSYFIAGSSRSIRERGLA